jgi:hypothetical protein
MAEDSLAAQLNYPGDATLSARPAGALLGAYAEREVRL